MSSNLSSEPPRVPPPPPPPAGTGGGRRRRVVFYGCAAAALLTLITMLVLGTLIFLVVLGSSGGGDSPSGSAPSPEPTVVEPPKEEQRYAAMKRLDQRLTRLARSNLAFNAPKQMQLGEIEIIRLTLSPSASPGELTQRLREAGAKGRIESAEQIITAKRMQAQLAGQAFEIEAIPPGSETQPITFAEPTDWAWEVKPIEGGENQKLHLTVTALLRVQGETTPRQIRSFDRTITVNVTFGQRVGGFADKHGEWLWTAILVPVAGAAYAWWRRRRSGGTTSPPPPSNRRPPPTSGLS